MLNRTQEQIPDFPLPRITEAVVEVVPPTPQERVQEQIKDFPVPRIMEAVVEVLPSTPLERVQNRPRKIFVVKCSLCLIIVMTWLAHWILSVSTSRAWISSTCLEQVVSWFNGKSQVAADEP